MTGKEIIELIKNYDLEDYTLDWCKDCSTDKIPHQQLRFIYNKPTAFTSPLGEHMLKLKFAYVDICGNTGSCMLRAILSCAPSQLPEHDYTPII